MEQITGHQSVRGGGGVIAVLYKTNWAGLSEPSWEREMDLHLSRSHILRYWAGTPDQHRQTNRLYRRMRIRAAQRELYRNNGEHFLAPGYACVPRADWLCRYHDTVLPKGAHFWYKGDDGLWWQNRREYYRGQGIPGPLSGRLGTDLTSSSPGALHDPDGSRTRLLVLSSSHRQCVPSGHTT